MAVPRNRQSKSKTKMRSSHCAKKKISISYCSNCNAVKLPHRVCPSCGHYAKKEIIKSETDES
jgi:large subunit ribosomal protein L32